VNATWLEKKGRGWRFLFLKFWQTIWKSFLILVLKIDALSFVWRHQNLITVLQVEKFIKLDE
jgi:hypothetical protein